MMAAWLGASPWLLGGSALGDGALAVNVLCAAAVCGFAVLSFVRSTRRAHRLAFGPATALTVYGWAMWTQGAYLHENHVLTGMVLMMLTLIPSEASKPPPGFRQPASSGPPEGRSRHAPLPRRYRS